MVLKKKQVIAMISITLVSFLIGTSMATDGGNPFHKIWEAIYELQYRVDSLNASLVELQSRVEALETRIPKKGYISISPATFNPTVDTRSYHLWGSVLEGEHYFVAHVQLPHCSTVKNMTVYLYDSSTSYGMDVKLYKFDLHEHHWCIASVDTWPAEETPGYAVLYDDTLLSPQVNNQHYLYYIAVWFDGQSHQLQLRGIVIEYEYQA